MSKNFYISGKWKKLEDIYSSLLDIIEDTETSDIAPLENRICAVSASDRLTFFLISKNDFVFIFSTVTNIRPKGLLNTMISKEFVCFSVFQVVFLKQHIVYNFQPLYALIGILFTIVVEYVCGYLYDILIISGQHGAKFMKI